MKRKRSIYILSIFVLSFAACAKPKAELSVSKTQIKQGESVSVNWKTENAKDVSLNGQNVAKTGTQVYQPTQTTTYELIGKRGKKEAKDSETVTVEVIAASPTITISTERGAITKGEKTRLRWSSQHADKVEIAGLGSFSPSGEREVAPLESITYTATAKGPGGEASASTRVTVVVESSKDTPDNRSSEEARQRFEREIRSIYFDYDKSDLRAEAMATLRSNAGFLLQSENRNIVFRLEGNCDPRGSEEYNLALGDRRANAAKTYLVSQGIDPSRMDVISNGKRNAKGVSEGSADTMPSWAHDRRDDSVYVKGGELLRR
jgi:peptidoglycan-associated lipoprotein